MANRIRFAVEFGKMENIMRNGDTVVVISGWNVESGSTNTIKIITVSDSMEAI